MESFTIELASNASAQLFRDNTLNFFANVISELLNLEGQWDDAISEVSYPSMYQNVRDGFFSIKNYQSCLNITIRNPFSTLLLRILLKPLNSQSRKAQPQGNCIVVKVSRRTQKNEIYFAIGGSSLAFFSKEVGHNFGSKVGNECEVMLTRKGSHKAEFPYDIVRIHSLTIYTDMIECKIVGDTKPHIMRCFPFISKLTAGNNITTEHYRNYQKFSNLQIRPLLKSSFHSIRIDL